MLAIPLFALRFLTSRDKKPRDKNKENLIYVTRGAVIRVFHSSEDFVQTIRVTGCPCPNKVLGLCISLERIGQRTSEIQVQPNSHTDGWTDG